MMIKGRNTLLVMLFSALVLLTGCGRDKDGTDAEPTDRSEMLIVGMDLTYPPFEYLNEKKVPVGVSVEMARALAEHLDKKLKIESTNFEGLEAALKTGDIDLIISSMTDTEKRRQGIDFSDPYAVTGLAMLVGKDSDIDSVDDLEKLNQEGRKVAVRLATTGESFAREQLKNAQIVSLTEDAACVLEVVQGRVDAWIYDQLSIFRYHELNAETTKPVLEPIRKEKWAIGIRKGNAELKEKVNEFLAKFREEGGFERLGEKFLAKEKKLLEQQGVPFILSDPGVD